MKWWIFTSVCVGALIALGVGAVDERDVLWEGRTPLCPYCRAEMPMQALVCRACDRSIDWLPQKEECGYCLTRKDADHMDDLFRTLRREGEALPEGLAVFGEAYFLAMEPGACTYCGGVGQVVEAGVKVACPACDDDRRCLACGGNRVVVVGDGGAHRRLLERTRVRLQAEVRADMTDLPLNHTELMKGDRDALRGVAEAEELPQVAELLQRARVRLKQAFRALHEEYARQRSEGRLPAGS